MSLADALSWLQQTAIATQIAESDTLFPIIETIHVLAITLVVGSIAVIDLRLLGISSRGHAVRTLSAEVLPITWTAFVVALISGSLMFSSKAVTYSHNFPFQAKMVLLLLAGINMAIFHAITYRGVEEWDTRHPAPRAARIAGALSLMFWVGVVAAGRWIGFVH